MGTPFDGLMGKIAPGLCRLSMTGNIAVKTSNGYKTYDVEKGVLINCDSFVFNIGEEFFFLIPTKKVKPGDIILAGGKPRCVIKTEPNLLTVINYEDSTIENLLPERHILMGNTYFYGKIVSMFGKNGVKGKNGMGKMMKFMMLTEMFKNNGNKDSGISSMLPLMMMMNGNNDMFSGLFDDEDDTDETDEEV